MKFSRLAFFPLAASVGLAASAQAATPALTHTVATFDQKKDKNGKAPEAVTYSNRDVTKVVKTTTKTPIYATILTPVYSSVKQPVYNAKGVVTGYKTVKIQTGTTTSQKLTGYTVSTTKAATITPYSKIYTKVGKTTHARSIAAVTTINLQPKGVFTGTVTGKQDALLRISAISHSPAVLSGYTFSQAFNAGSIRLRRTVALRAIGANGHAVGPLLNNLLRIRFTNAVLTGDTQTDMWTLSSDNSFGGLKISSSFFDVASVTAMPSYGFSFGGLASFLGLAPTDPSYTSVTGAHSLSSFTSNVSGSLSTSAVPEPATWAMMILGMGAVGVAMRRRRAAAASGTLAVA